MQAILLLAHKGLSYIENFIKQFDLRFNIYIHQDIKNQLKFDDIQYLYETYPNIKCIISKINCKYCDVNIIDAEILLIKEALKDKSNTYLHLMSEQCYLSHTTNYFYNYFENNDNEYIWINNMFGTVDDYGYPNLWRVINNKYHYYGGQWFSLTYNLLNEIINDKRLSEFHKEMEYYANNPDNDTHRQAIDEVYFQNFIMEFGYTKKYKISTSKIDNSLRFVDWLARNPNDDCTHPGNIDYNSTFGKQQFNRIITGNYLIVRKVDFMKETNMIQLNRIRDGYKEIDSIMEKQLTKVSVCMCTRNRAFLMLPAIKCILQQTYFNIEFIIIDDCSTDNTEDICNTLMQQDSRIKYVRLPKHDFIEARNTAFRMATGDFICLIDSDDKCSPNKIEEQLKYMVEHPDIDIIGCKIKFGKKTSNLSIPKTFNSWGHDYFENELVNNNENISMLLHFPSIMIRKSILDKVFPNKTYFYPEMKNGGEDQLFLYSLYLNNAKFGNCAEGVYLYNYLEYDDAISASVGKHFDEDNFIFKYIHNKPLEEKLKVTKELYTKYIINGEA